MSWLSAALEKITLEDILLMLDPGVVENVAGMPNLARMQAYAAIDRIPARWGTFAKFLFRLFARQKLRDQVDRWIKQATGD